MSPSSPRRALAAICLAVGLSVAVVGFVGLAAAVVDGSGASQSAELERPSNSVPASPTAPPEPVPGLALPERVELEGSVTGDFVTPSIDVGAAVHREGVTSRAAYEGYLLEARLDRAEEGEREQLLADALDAANESARALAEQERSIAREYRTGDIDAREYVSRLRAIGSEAAAREARLSVIEERGDDAIAREAQLRQRGYFPLQGELRSYLSAVARGERSSGPVYVAAGDQGTVLATVDGGYRREVFRPDLIHPADWERTGSGEVLELLRTQLYPEFQEDAGFTNIFGPAFATVYRAEGPHDHGVLTAHVDVASGDVFREYQELELDSDLPTRSAREASGAVTLRVNRTYASGPALVRVLEDGEPAADARVVLDGTEVATTDGDGSTWVVLPYGEHEIAASVDGASVTMGLNWSEDSS